MTIHRVRFQQPWWRIVFRHRKGILLIWNCVLCKIHIPGILTISTEYQDVKRYFQECLFASILQYQIKNLKVRRILLFSYHMYVHFQSKCNNTLSSHCWILYNASLYHSRTAVWVRSLHKLRSFPAHDCLKNLRQRYANHQNRVSYEPADTSTSRFKWRGVIYIQKCEFKMLVK